jgi:phospholipase C
MAGLQTVKSIVHLMMENRSLDNLLGYLYYPNNTSPNGDAFDGLTGTETNPRRKGKPVSVQPETKDTSVPTPDPGEEYQHVNMQLFQKDPAPNPPVATNQGFAIDYQDVDGAPADIMKCYDPRVPHNLAKLCRDYAVCDAWYAPVPTQTWANRAFAHAGTSWGMVNNFPYDPFKWKMPTIFQRMTTLGMPWRVYYDESVISFTRLQFSPLLKSTYKGNFLPFAEFLHDANAGALPKYAFIEPNFFTNYLTGKKQSDMHPPSDIVPGDQFICQVFNAIVTGPQWHNNEVLFVITFDEHGGCYDHVHPPTNATPPDGRQGQRGFDFKRFGVRVPAVVVSPFVTKGSVFHAPKDATPYDHTSILATIERAFGIPSLTDRDAAAPDLGAILGDVARIDGVPLPLAPPAAHLMLTPAERAASKTTPLNELQRSMVEATKKVLVRQPARAAMAVAKGPTKRRVATVEDARRFFDDAKAVTGL